MSGSRKQLAIKRKSKVLKLKASIFFTIIVIVMTAGIILKSQVLAGESSNSHKTYYKSIEIEAGDSLWSIAEEYRTAETESIHEYISTLKSINSLKSDDIHESKYLMVAYHQ